jgi:hypothetical protein
MRGTQHIAVKLLPGPMPEQARDARARAWAFVFQCWQEKQRTAKPSDPDDLERSSSASDVGPILHE